MPGDDMKWTSCLFAIFVIKNILNNSIVPNTIMTLCSNCWSKCINTQSSVPTSYRAVAIAQSR